MTGAALRRGVYSFDSSCLDLARHFYPDLPEHQLATLAHELQRTAEDFSCTYELRKRSRCEYNPVLRRPSTDPPGDGDCPNLAAVSLGRDGAYHVCASCAALPELRRYRVRTPLPSKRMTMHSQPSKGRSA